MNKVESHGGCSFYFCVSLHEIPLPARLEMKFEDTSIDMEAVRWVCLLRAYIQVLDEAECWCVIRRKVRGKGETKREISRRETGMTAGTR